MKNLKSMTPKELKQYVFELIDKILKNDLLTKKGHIELEDCLHFLSIKEEEKIIKLSGKEKKYIGILQKLLLAVYEYKGLCDAIKLSNNKKKIIKIINNLEKELEKNELLDNYKEITESIVGINK
jgi:hypothetical protein